MSDESTISDSTAVESSAVEPTTTPVATTPVTAMEAAGDEAQSNPFDLWETEGGTDAPPQTPDAPDDTPYVLDMGGDYDGTQEITDMITTAAKDCGLDAKAAGNFVAQVCAGLKADQQKAMMQGSQALMKEWGASYDANMKGAAQFLKAVSSRLGIYDLTPLMNPAVFKIAHVMRQMGGTAAAAGVTSMDTRTSQQKFDGLMSDPVKHAILMNPLHKDYQKIAAEANSYLPSPLF